MQDDQSANYILTNNIDCSATSGWNGGAGFIPIGTDGNGSYGGFSGTFNGQSYTIDHLTIDSSVNALDVYTGLFGVSVGVVSNVFLTNVLVTGAPASSGFIPPSTGALVGFNEGIVQKVSVSGTVNSGCTGSTQLGGFIGYDLGGRISQSSFSGNVTLSPNCQHERVGGFIGNTYNTSVNNSYSSGAVTVNGEGSTTDAVGGFIGTGGGDFISITNSYSTTSVTVQGASLLVPSYQAGSFIGALLNASSTSITNDFTTGAVSIPATCSNTDCGTSPRVANAFIGDDSTGDGAIDLSTDYYDQTGVGVGLSQCDSIGSPCNAINTDGSQPAYFMDSLDVLNPPIDQWDFNTAWQTNSGFPLLRISPSPYPDPPTGVVATPVSDTALDVTWNDPNYSGTSAIQSFIVQYKANGTSDWQSGFINGDNDELVLTGLTPGTQYAVEVFAVNNDNNISQPSSTILATMGLDGYTPISNCQQLQDMNNNLSGNYYLTNNIDCSATSGWNGGLGFTPLGDIGGDVSTAFSGTLEGNDYTITNLTSGNIPIANLGGETVGLFAYTADGATFRDIRFNTPSLSGNEATLFLYLQDSTVSNVQVENVNISGGSQGSNVAGLTIDDTDSTIDQTSVTGHLVSSGGIIGGLVATVDSAGGGSTLPTITNSYVDVTLTGGNQNDVIGGLVGLDGSSDLVISDSYATGTITEGGTGNNAVIGGLIGADGVASQTKDSFSNMRIENTDTSAQVGGLIGTASSSTTTNDYYNADFAGTTQCSGDTTAACTAVNTNSSSPSYFYANKTNPPLEGWDFTNTWEITNLTPTFLTNSSVTPVTVATSIKPVLTKPAAKTSTSHTVTEVPTATPLTVAKPTTSAKRYNTVPTQPQASSPVSASAAISAAIQHFIRHVPKAVLVSFPYVLFSLLLLGALAVVIEILRQSRRLREDQLLLAKQRTVAEERDTFWHLAANYLRAPITLLSGGAELLTLSKTVEPVAADIDQLAKKLQAKVAEIMKKIEGSHSLRDIALPSVKASRSVTRRLAFWIPIVIIAMLAALSDYVARDFRHLSTSFINYATQAALLVIAVFVLQWVLNGLGLVSQKRKQIALLVSEQANDLAQARRLLIGATADELDADLTSLERLLRALPKEEQAQETLREGALRLRHIVDSFQLLMSAQSDSLATISPPTTTTSLQKTVSNVLDSLKPLIDSKKIHISLTQLNNIVVPGSPKLLDQIISSTLSNAVQFSPAGGTITIALGHEHGATNLSISDEGRGMSDEQQVHLFKPFTRADYKESLQLNHDGIGINLYIDKLLMDYLGGTITATSKVGSGTTFNLSWPTNREIQAGMFVLPAHRARQHVFGAS